MTMGSSGNPFTKGYSMGSPKRRPKARKRAGDRDWFRKKTTRCASQARLIAAIVASSRSRESSTPEISAPRAPATGERRATSSRDGELDDAASDDGELAVLIARLLLDLDEVPPALDALADDGALDTQDVALGIVAANLAVRPAEDPVVAHPVGQVMGQPRAALGAVVVGAG